MTLRPNRPPNDDAGAYSPRRQTTPSPPQNHTPSRRIVACDAGGACPCPLRGCINGLFYGAVCPVCCGRGVLFPEAA